MPKIRFDKDALKGFFALHVEKIVLGVVVLLLVVFVYTGYSLEGLPSNRAPDDLLDVAKNRVKNHINDPTTWSQIASDYAPPEEKYRKRVEDIQVPINMNPYRPEKSFSPPAPSGTRRSDPELFPPQDIEVVAMVGSVAYYPQRDETDPLADAKNAEYKEDDDKPKRRGRGRRDRDEENNPYGGMGGFPGMAGPGGAGGLGIPGMEGGEGEDEGGIGGMPGMPGMPGIGGGGMTGMGAAGGAIMASPTSVEGYRPPPGSIPKSRTIVGVKVLVPYEKQWGEYETKFSTAMGYQPSRDTPRYLGYFAERAEVTDESDTDLDWKPISSTSYIIKQIRERRRPYGGWAGFPQELADPRYVKPNVLTMPVPPVMMKPLDELALHSKIPRRDVRPTRSEEDDGKSDDPEPEDDGGTITSDPIAGVAGRGAMPGGYGGDFGDGGMATPGMPGGMGAPGMPGGMGAPGMPGGMGTPGMPGMPGGMGAPGMPGGVGAPGGMGAPGMAGGMPYGGEDEEGGYGGEYGGYGPGMSGVANAFSPQAEFFMVRFFDMTARPGKKYRYRVQVLLEDPNHPQSPALDPNNRALSKEVRARLEGIDAKTRLNHYLKTDFSEPSEIVTVELVDKTFAGDIAEVRETRVNANQNEFEIPIAEPSADVMAVVWDIKRGLEVPVEVEAYRGSLLNFTKNADVLHPVTLIYKTIEDYPFKTNRLVLDFRGGEELPVTGEEPDEPLRAPGEFLFMDDKGELYVGNELDDWEEYQQYLLPEAPSDGGGMFGGEGGYPGYGGDGGDGGDMLDGMDPYGGYGGEGGSGRRGGRRRGGGGDDS